ncbi:hypothetical protein GGF46_004615 [Coemansia sp. RSA 552]|nr:hypothetical protein GGF46_004615 [Coemansia sp. RSA 552]
MESDESLFDELFGAGSDSSRSSSRLSQSSGEAGLDPAGLYPADLAGPAQAASHSEPSETCTSGRVERPAPGFVIYRQALSPDLCARYFGWLSSEYFTHTPTTVSSPDRADSPRINQGMHFGALTDRETPLGNLSHLSSLLPELLPASVRSRPVLFDQAIINLYDPGEGIGDHVDLLRFADGVVGFSFGSSATIRLQPVTGEAALEQAARYAKETTEACPEAVLLRLDPGDVYAMSGDARYGWTHGFPSHVNGAYNVTSRRISVTLRKLND